jgi:mercuric ion transport protein
MIGLGGAWLSALGAFVAYRVEILIVAGLVILWAWFRFLRRWSCKETGAPALIFLAFATLSLGIAASSPLWEREAARIMFGLWSGMQ